MWHIFEGQSVELTFWHWNYACSQKFDSQNMASLWHPFEGQSADPRMLLWIKIVEENSIHKMEFHYDIWRSICVIINLRSELIKSFRNYPDQFLICLNCYNRLTTCDMRPVKNYSLHQFVWFWVGKLGFVLIILDFC